jgi:hypothetical protein
MNAASLAACEHIVTQAVDATRRGQHVAYARY